MGRIYTAKFENVAVTAVQDLFEIVAPTDASVRVHAWELGQTSEVADAAEEILEIKLVRGEGSVTSGSGGSTPAVPPLVKGDAAAGTVVEANNTTQMVVGSGTLTELTVHAWNIRVPYEKLYAPELRPLIAPGDRLVIELETTPADSITMYGTVWFEEVGG